MRVQAAPPPSTTAQMAQRVLAYVADDLTSSWRPEPYLEPIEAILAVQPELPTARLRYRAGEIKQPDQDTFQSYHAPDLLGKWVTFCVFNKNCESGETATVVPWYGLVLERDALPLEAASAETYFDVTYRAYGIEHLLDEVRLDSTYGWGVPWPGDFYTAARVFNRGRHGAGGLVGNQRGALTLFNELQTPDINEAWSAADVIRYLLTWHAPTTHGITTWTLTGNYDFLEDYYAVWQLEGMTLRQALNTVISRRRGYMWRCFPGAPGEVLVHVEPVFAGAFSVAGNQFRGNSAVFHFNLESLPQQFLADVRLRLTVAHRYHQVRVYGEPMRVVWSPDSAYIYNDWEATDETNYRNALGDDPEENDLYRAQPQFRDVFTKYLLAYGRTGYADYPNPLITENGTLDESTTAPMRMADTPILNWLVLPDGTITRPFAVGKLVNDDRYVLLHRPVVEEAPPIGLSVGPAEGDLKIRFLAPYNHCLCFNAADTESLGQGDGPTTQRGGNGSGCWYEHLAITVAVETGQRLRYYATIPDTPTDGPALVIYVPDAHLWYVGQNTIIGIASDGSLERTTEGQIVRDDSDYLRQVAGLAVAWYGYARETARLVLRYIEPAWPIAGILWWLNFGEAAAQIGTPITRLRFDFTRLQTELVTGFWHLDFAEMVGGLAEHQPALASLRRQVERLTTVRGDQQ